MCAVTLDAYGSLRCYNLCIRNEDRLGCRRCRFREPLRFGKRDFDIVTLSPSIPADWYDYIKNIPRLQSHGSMHYEPNENSAEP